MRNSKLTTPSYKCLEWNVGKSQADNYNTLPKSKVPLHKLPSNRMTLKSTIIDYDQVETENRYRCLSDKKFHFNPFTFGVDCQSKAFAIHKNLLNMVGSDVISINNPLFFEMVDNRISFLERMNIKNREIQRIKDEKHRILEAQIKLRNFGKRIRVGKTRSVSNYQKFVDESRDKTSRDCENFSYDSNTKSFDSMSGDCVRFEYNLVDKPIQQFDSLDEEAHLFRTFDKAERFIHRTLIQPKEEKLKPMIFPAELGIYATRIESQDANSVNQTEKAALKMDSYNRKPPQLISRVNLKSCCVKRATNENILKK